MILDGVLGYNTLRNLTWLPVGLWILYLGYLGIEKFKITSSQISPAELRHLAESKEIENLSYIALILLYNKHCVNW